MEEALVAFLLADAALDALVGNRIYWVRRPQDEEALPTVVLTKISHNADYHMTAPSGLFQTRLQVDCWGETFASVTNTARAVKNILSGASFTQSGIDFQGCFLDNERQLFEDEEPTRLHRISMDFIIWHS